MPQGEPAYFHSVRLDTDRCKGCTNCIKRCPTEAIRVRGGKAMIIEERCIDCGECIRVCQNHAKLAVTDTLARLNEFDYSIALPAPSLFGQFKGDIHPARVLAALVELGFDSVFEVALAADAVTVAIREALQRDSRPRPLIASACPAVIRLMQVRFPGLLSRIVDVESPMEIAARVARARAAATTGLRPDRIGTFFISPCPAKMTAAKQPVGQERSAVSGVLSIASIFSDVLKKLTAGASDPSLQRASGPGLGWGRAGGECQAIGRGSLLQVDGIHSVIAVLEEVEKGKLQEVDYLEAQACVGGCIGGPLTVENPFIARVRLRTLAETLNGDTSDEARELGETGYRNGALRIRYEIEPRPVMKLDADVARAIAKMDRLEATLKRLPGLDCGSCGSPTCRSLAEDIVRETALETDCVFRLRNRVQELAEEVLALARKVPPAMGTGDDKSGSTGEGGRE
ncbi:MAG: [Fe-Fe] hydrogenase large subunit C-terminal domain-containing protein [Chloroflexota bacterium]